MKFYKQNSAALQFNIIYKILGNNKLSEIFSCFVGPVIDKVLGLRCMLYGYQYSEIVGSLSIVYSWGGDCAECIAKCRTVHWPTPHGAMANAACGVVKHYRGCRKKHK